MLEVGRVLRAHGLHGETVVHLVSNRAERASPGARFETDAGELVVQEVRAFRGGWLMRFAGITAKEQADALRGVVLRAPALHDDDALWVHELVGCVVVGLNDDVVLGTVVSVVSNPASDLLELDDGGLVPVRFVVQHEPGRLVVDVPAGLRE